MPTDPSLNDPVQVKNAADRGQVDRAAEVARDEQADHLNAVRTALSTTEGRRAIWDWCVMLGLFKSVYAASSQIYHSAGMQDAARRIWTDCEEASLDLCETMHREAVERQKLAVRERQIAQRRQRAR